jgi:hypothetical protein
LWRGDPARGHCPDAVDTQIVSYADAMEQAESFSKFVTTGALVHSD